MVKQTRKMKRHEKAPKIDAIDVPAVFTPFTLRTSDGSRFNFNVPHREVIFITVVATRAGYVNVLDPLHIVSIEEAKSLPS
jgi:hypothetical protein